MASTSVTKIGGVVVVTQVIPEGDASIPLQSAAPPQAPPPAAQTPPPSKASRAKLDDVTAGFLQGEPQALGVVQIVVGLLCAAFSLTAVFSPLFILHAAFCGALVFVVSGALAVAAARRSSVRLVTVSLAWNLLSVVVALGGVAYDCWLLSRPPAGERFCDDWRSVDFTPTERSRCLSNMRSLNVAVYGPLGLILVLLVLQLCVATATCVLSVNSIRRRRCYVPVLVDDGARTPLCAAPPSPDSDVGLLDSSDEGNSYCP
ncbi:uncharacterized protein V6R79_005142 [Siganus canaliculatus]